MHSRRQKTIVGAGLVVALAGVLNLIWIDLQFAGLSSKQLAILAFFPLVVVMYMIQNNDAFR